jgi:hypothetical protein
MPTRATPQPKATAARPPVYTRSTFCALIKAPGSSKTECPGVSYLGIKGSERHGFRREVGEESLRAHHMLCPPEGVDQRPLDDIGFSLRTHG